LRPDPTILFFSGTFKKGLNFITALMSIVPLAYYIGMAVSSISAQSTFAVGAVLNATFGSMIELILYCSAIKMGTLDELVQSAVTGNVFLCLICQVLFLQRCSCSQDWQWCLEV
jgi:Ca2+:H+ antiporter